MFNQVSHLLAAASLLLPMFACGSGSVSKRKLTVQQSPDAQLAAAGSCKASGYTGKGDFVLRRTKTGSCNRACIAALKSVCLNNPGGASVIKTVKFTFAGGCSGHSLPNSRCG